MAINNANNPSSVSIYLGTVASTKTVPAIYFGRRTALKAAWLVNGVTLAHDGTNYVVVDLKNSAGPVELAKFDGSTQDLAANVGTALVAQQPPLVGTQGGLYTGQSASNSYPLDIPAGASLEVVITAHGTVTLTDSQLVLEYWEL